MTVGERERERENEGGNDDDDDDHVRGRASIDALAELLGTVILVEEIVSDLLQIGQMAMEQGAANGQEIRVTGIIDLDDAPWILTSSDSSTTNLDDVLGTDDGEGHQASEFGVLLDGVLIIFVDVIGKVVDGNPIMFDIFHDEFLGLGQLGRRQRIGLADDGDYVDSRRQAFHELDIQFSETEKFFL